MSKSALFSNKAFVDSASNGIGFNLVPQMNSFNAVFQTKPLENAESDKIRRLLHDNLDPDKMTEEQTSRDADQLKQITAEIKAISRQGAILLGERVYRAREILKAYQSGAFTQWLEATFGSRKTGYNMLAYYELYNALPHDGLKEKFKQMPNRAAYILAAKQGDFQAKVAMINENYQLGHRELVGLIRSAFPTLSRAPHGARFEIKKLGIALNQALKEAKKQKYSFSREEQAVLKELMGSIYQLKIRE